MLTKYFEAKIGTAIYRRVTSGSRDFAGPSYAKQYKAEILSIDRRTYTDNVVTVNVTLEAYTPSGCRDGSFKGNKYLGDHHISTDVLGLEVWWSTLISKVDPGYVQFLDKEQRER